MSRLGWMRSLLAGRKGSNSESTLNSRAKIGEQHAAIEPYLEDQQEGMKAWHRCQTPTGRCDLKVATSLLHQHYGEAGQ